jgi:hypothetical protein
MVSTRLLCNAAKVAAATQIDGISITIMPVKAGTPTPVSNHAWQQNIFCETSSQQRNYESFGEICSIEKNGNHILHEKNIRLANLPKSKGAKPWV